MYPSCGVGGIVPPSPREWNAVLAPLCAIVAGSGLHPKNLNARADRNAGKATQRKAYEIDSSIVTRVCSGERELPPKLRKHYSGPDALEWIKLCFAADIALRIQDSAKTALTQKLLALIEQDAALAAGTKLHFIRCAAEGELGNFLAEVYLCAVSQRDTGKRTANLPLFL